MWCPRHDNAVGGPRKRSELLLGQLRPYAPLGHSTSYSSSASLSIISVSAIAVVRFIVLKLATASNTRPDLSNTRATPGCSAPISRPRAGTLR